MKKKKKIKKNRLIFNLLNKNSKDYVNRCTISLIFLSIKEIKSALASAYRKKRVSLALALLQCAGKKLSSFHGLDLGLCRPVV